MSDAVLSWVEKYMLSRTGINTKPYTDTPVESGLPYPILLGAALVTRDFSEVDQFQFARRSSCALPSCLPVGSNNPHRPHHGCMSHKPGDHRVADWNMGLDVVLKPNLQRPDLPFDKSYCRFSCTIGLWVVFGGTLDSHVHAIQLQHVDSCVNKFQNCGFVVAPDTRTSVAKPQDVVDEVLRCVAIGVSALLRYSECKDRLGRAADAREHPNTVVWRILPLTFRLILEDQPFRG